MANRFVLLCVVLALHGTLPRTAAAQDSAPEPAAAVRWRTSIKVSALVARAPDAPALFAERVSGDTLWRVRTEPVITIGPRVVVTVAYEQRLRWGSGSSSGLTTILPRSAAAPFRASPLDWSIVDSDNHTWQHEIDRLNVRVRTPRADITVGRQAIGWGRGVMFGAVDLLAPFSPLEADREWRRGVDAVHADVKLTDRSSFDVVAAAGRRWEDSAIAGRVRGYTGSIDLELMSGRRGRDLFGGAATSAAIGDAAVHGEAALFAIPSVTVPDRRTGVWKVVLGGSYRFPLGSGVLTYAEYHYSGFGASRSAQILPLLATPSFQSRYLRGDTQILSRHAVAVTGSYEHAPDLTWSGQWVFNPADGSGVIVPGVTFTLRENASLGGTVYLPYGRAPAGTLLRSEYGATPLAALLQLRVFL